MNAKVFLILEAFVLLAGCASKPSGIADITKEDGSLTWTAVADSTFTENINGIAYGNGRFVAVGVSGRMAYSLDGVTWKAVVDSKFGAIEIYDVAYAEGKFIAVGGAGQETMMRTIKAYSNDGITWTAILDNYTRSWGLPENKSIAYGNGKWVVGMSWDDMAYSTNGETWTTISTGNGETKGIAFGSGKFVAVGTKSQTIRPIVYSADGIAWTSVDHKIFDGSINAIVYANGKFIAGGENGKMAYSKDGITWAEISDSQFPGNRIDSIVYGAGKFVAVGTASKIAYSEDGITWTAMATNEIPFPDNYPTGNIYSIVYGGGRFVVVGAGGIIAYSNIQG